MEDLNTKIEWFFVGQDIQIQAEGEFDIESFYSELGDLITCNEINRGVGYDLLCYDSKVFELYFSDVKQLKERGFCKAYFIGELKDILDLNNEVDLDFAKWYYGAENITEILSIWNNKKE